MRIQKWLALAYARRLDRRAGRIGEPVAKLRYLRRATAQPTSFGLMRRTSAVAWIVAVTLALGLSPGERRRRSGSEPSGRVVRAAGGPVRAPHGNEPAGIWQVTSSAAFDLYSNGLRVDNAFRTEGEPRHYRRFPLDSDVSSDQEWHSEPIGIVFHTSEGDFRDFSPAEAQAIQRDFRGLLAYVKRHQSYHFVIDRFGQVFRVVDEQWRASHAGSSVWADAAGAYIGLNDSFFGICFHTRTKPDDPEPGITTAQLRSGRMLVELLRERYRIPELNCLTHAQVSANYSNFRIGYHTDWAGNFPFGDLGLRDNYDQPLPSVWRFGFRCDNVFIDATGARLWSGVVSAEQRLQERAAAVKLPAAEYRRQLQKTFQQFRKEEMEL